MQQQNYSVGIYVRLSKDDERAGESVSIENQKLMLRKYVTEQGWDEVGCYVDDGFSGTNLERPGIQRLLEDAKDGRVNLILVKDMSRLGRNYIEVGRLTDYVFPMIGCHFIALNDGVDSIHSDNDIAPFRNLFNEFHSRDTSKKIKAAMRACAGSGKFVGAMAPLGYKKSPDDKHKFVIDEQSAPLIRRIFDMRCTGLSYRRIADILNDEKVITPRDYYYQQKGGSDSRNSHHVWSGNVVMKILHNETYIGNMIHGKVGNASYKNRQRVCKPEEEWIKVEGTHEPIIEMDVWKQCSDLKRRLTKPRSAKNGTQSLFCGLLKCMDCGGKLSYRKDSRSNGTIYESYSCGIFVRCGKSACSSHTVKQSQLEDLVIDDIHLHAKRVLEDEEATRRELIEKRRIESEQQLKADRTQIKSLESRLAELDRLIQGLYEEKILSGLSDAVFKKLMTQYERERFEKAETLAILTEKLNAAAKDEQDIERFMQMIRKYVAVETLDREMLLEVIDYIEVGERFIKDKKKYRDVIIHYQILGKIN